MSLTSTAEATLPSAGPARSRAAASLIAKLERRDRLSNEERKALEGAAVSTRTFAAGQDLVCEGDRPGESILIVEGMTGRYNIVESGGRQITAIHVPGDFIDLHSLLLHTMDHSIMALTPCLVCTYSHEALIGITETMPHLTRMLWLETLIDAAIHRRWIVTMGRLAANQRLAHVFCELALRLETVGLAQDHAYDLPLTQAEFGDLLGLSLVHINRVAQQLRRQNLINWSGGRLTILDWDGLAALAEFNPDYLNLQREQR